MSVNKAVSIKDVAQRAGVSAMTVSLVLRDESSGSRVSPETRRRVMDAAGALRYRPNAVGRALRSGRTNIIGLYAGHGYINVRFPFFTEIVSGLQEGCEHFRKDLLLHGVFHGRTSDAIFAELADGRIDGLVLHMPPDNPLVKRLDESHLPVVAVADPLPNIPSVVADDAAGARMLAEHVFRQGHQRVVFLHSDVYPLSAQRRRDALRESAAANGMAMQEVMVSDRLHLEDFVAEKILTEAPSQRPTAVFCWNDGTAYGLLANCYKHGLRVPDDLAILGFDGFHSPHEVVGPLTTIRAPWAKVAWTAVQHLVGLMNGETVPPETVLPVEFIPGQTA